MLYNSRMKHEGIDRDRLSVLTGGLLLALALSRFLDIPVRPWATTVFGSPLGFDISATTVMIVLVTGMAIAGVESLVRSHPLARRGELEFSAMFWIVPGLLGLALAAWLSRIDSVTLWTMALLAASILMPLSLAAEYAAVDPRQRSGTLLHWSQTALVYLVALLLFTTIYSLGARSLISATAVLLAAALLTARLLWPLLNDLWETVAYAAVVGLLLGQAVWVLNYWPWSGLRGGLLLLLFFYVITGLIDQSLNGRFNRRIVLEYSGVALLALLAVIWIVA
jgi:hypothetical protein